MKKYSKPTLDVVVLDTADVITTSLPAVGRYDVDPNNDGGVFVIPNP